MRYNTRWMTGMLAQAARRRVLFTMASLSLLAAAGGVGGAVAATSDPDPKAEPQVFVEQVARQALQVLKDDPQLKSGDVRRVNTVIDEYLLPYVNFEKTTRLAAGRYWREATPAQREALAREFRGTLVRTYSGALRDVNPTLDIRMLPFRGDPQANDVVVRTEVVQSGMQPAAVDYRLERTPEGWKVYDLSVEGIWLIQNYRNQFASVIQQQGIDGLIKTLAQRNQ